MKIYPSTMLAICFAFALRAEAQQGTVALPAKESASSVRLREARVALRASEEENAKIKERILIQENAIKALTESLAIANNESEMFKRDAANLRLKIETLGIESVSGNRAKIEQRLLAAVRDLRLSQKENEQLKEQIDALTQATQIFLSSAADVDPQARLEIETEVRRANSLLAELDKKDGVKSTSSLNTNTLNEGSVIDVKSDIALIVVDLGERQGVKVGMPFQILRGKESIGEVRVVDVRDRIAGAVVQNLASPTDSIKVGDRLRMVTK